VLLVALVALAAVVLLVALVLLLLVALVLPAVPLLVVLLAPTAVLPPALVAAVEPPESSSSPPQPGIAPTASKVNVAPSAKARVDPTPVSKRFAAMSLTSFESNERATLTVTVRPRIRQENDGATGYS
jgi:hypothetical protein